MGAPSISRLMMNLEVSAYAKYSLYATMQFGNLGIHAATMRMLG